MRYCNRVLSVLSNLFVHLQFPKFNIFILFVHRQHPEKNCIVLAPTKMPRHVTKQKLLCDCNFEMPRCPIIELYFYEKILKIAVDSDLTK